jgi:(3,5-dihydroxyphenyl)acetyl-CoA 1,2-dioxygenase
MHRGARHSRDPEMSECTLRRMTLYDELTDGRTRFVRVDELCRHGAERRPDVLPSAAELAAEAARMQRDKLGVERKQGAFLGEVLSDPGAGVHLCHAMLLPHPASAARLAEYAATGALELPGASVVRVGKASVVTTRNPRFLNAEDESTLDGFEIAIDVATLDPHSEICVLRGGPVEHPRYAGRRLLGAGINLTHLYQGKIRYLWFLIRDLGLVNKLYRGVALPDVPPEHGGVEKPWIAVIEGFAIGGHCQILLTVDYTIAADDAYLTLPARKEGILPGAANLRLPRFVGDRIARQAIMNERRIDCASPEGRLICDAIVAPGEVDAAIETIIDRLTNAGVVSAAGNRRAIRIAQEPLDTFRRYMSVYAREQAHCYLSPALVQNLERHWDAASRRG